MNRFSFFPVAEAYFVLKTGGTGCTRRWMVRLFFVCGADFLCADGLQACECLRRVPDYSEEVTFRGKLNSPSAQHRWHASTQTTRTGMRHMNSEIKTGGKVHRLFHQFFAERQRSCTFTGCKHRIRVLYLAVVIRLLKISHTILHLQCAERVFCCKMAEKQEMP